MARNYGKATRRYAVGGIVPKQADEKHDASEDYKDERELELPQNRNLWRKQAPVTSDENDKDYVDPDWREKADEDA